MFGPQVFPSLGYRLTGRDSLGTYLKYSPILSGGDLTFASREFATGLAWTRSLPNSRAFSVSFDFGLLDLVIKKVLKIRSQTMSLSAGYSF
jgi:hypothetical protein